MSQFDDDFWSDGSESTGSVDIGGSFEVVPHGTKCKIHIEDIEWKYYDEKTEQNQDGLNIPWVKATWCIESPADYENIKVTQKIKYYGDDPTSQHFKPEKDDKVKEKARLVFWAIDKNCGSKLTSLKLRRRATDEELQRYLIGKPMLGVIGVWDINGKTGNYIMKIEPLNSGNVPKQAAKPATKRNEPIADHMDDDIPFN